MSRRDLQHSEPAQLLDDELVDDDAPHLDDYSRCWVCGADLASGMCGGIGGELAECPYY